MRPWPLTLSATLALSGCAGAAGHLTTSLPAPTPVAVTPTGPPPVRVATPVEASIDGPYAADPRVIAFNDYLAARNTAFLTDDPDLPGLAEFSTSSRLGYDRAAIARYDHEHYRLESPFVVGVVGVNRTGASTANLAACQDEDRTVLVDTSTGKRVRTGRRWSALQVRMVQEAGQWKVNAVYNVTFACRGL